MTIIDFAKIIKGNGERLTAEQIAALALELRFDQPVVIDVRGGMVEVTKKPAQVRVLVIDRDVRTAEGAPTISIHE